MSLLTFASPRGKSIRILESEVGCSWWFVGGRSVRRAPSRIRAIIAAAWAQGMSGQTANYSLSAPKGGQTP